MKLRCNFCQHRFERKGEKLEYKCPKCHEIDVEPETLVTVSIPHLKKASVGPPKPPLTKPSRHAQILNRI